MSVCLYYIIWWLVCTGCMRKRRTGNDQTHSGTFPNSGKLWQVVECAFCRRKFMTLKDFWIFKSGPYANLS